MTLSPENRIRVLMKSNSGMFGSDSIIMYLAYFMLFSDTFSITLVSLSQFCFTLSVPNHRKGVSHWGAVDLAFLS
jgi:hypothetical protein